MSSLRDIPEIVGLDTHQFTLRIPPEIDVPLTTRVRHLIDTPDFRRLAHVSQVGLVSLVYPAANHTRFEHSLGVYRLALCALKQLSYQKRFVDTIQRADGELFIVAALLHDLGQWPFCHPIEDLHLPGLPLHEKFAASYLLKGEVADVLRDDWNIDPDHVVAILSQRPCDRRSRILASLLSGPIDIDKLDYLQRDSLHAGVLYGRRFDEQRLIGSLCLNSAGNGLAITDKGKTAAELLMFSRYLMFSEVYWHHSVRAATAMLQRAFYLLYREIDYDALLKLTDASWIGHLRTIAGKTPAGELLDGLFGPTRRLYKQIAEFSAFQQRNLYRQVARRPYPWLAACSARFANLATKALGLRVRPCEVLFDAPPVKREPECDVEVYFPKERCYRPFAEISPLVKMLTTETFDDCVKRVRVFVHPRLSDDLRSQPELLNQAIAKSD